MLSMARGYFGKAVKLKGARTRQLRALASELHFSKSKRMPLPRFWKQMHLCPIF